MTMFQGSSSSTAVSAILQAGRKSSEGKVEVQDKVCRSAFPVTVHPYYLRHAQKPDLAAIAVVIGIAALAIAGFVAVVYAVTKVL